MMGSIPGEALVWVRLAIIVSLALCVALFFGRAVGSTKDPARRPAWIASLFGLIAILTLGMVIPLRWVDAALGGSNFWNLAQALCATIAFWFFYRATRLGAGLPGPEKPRWFALSAVLGGQTVLFALIQHRGGTSETFVRDYITDPACYAYLMLYIVTIGVLTGRSALIRARKLRGTSIVFFAGFALVALACATHVVYLTMAHFEWGQESQSEALRGLFYLIFGPGILLLIVAFAKVFVQRQRKLLQPVWRVRALRLALIRRKVTDTPLTLLGACRALFLPEPRARANSESTVLYDATNAEDALLTSSERHLLERTNSGILRHLGLEDELRAMAEVVQ
ncbi:hypothetical protein [Rathayibacter sp. AY1A7]|uniref:hypothetical protein n=1 Tax=Rathayibacter sp. AY1A7 TaxID=2080524 RepID=UPI000CE78823|nr:hypothetical protein [Rathayibacter sp. AY1A7]PPF18338.1 hypothetical protein C5B95_12100 [Rathayibacter sp. AY1A7]